MKNFPKRFVERIQEILPQDQWDNFFEMCTEPLPKTIRVSKSKFGPLQSSANLNPTWELKPVADIPEAFFIDRENRDETALGRTLEHFCGEIYIASASSLLAAKVLNPEPGDKVLDMCAAPGSKSTFLSEMIGSEGVLVANELSSSRSKKLTANLDRMGCQNVVVLQSDGTNMNTFLDQEFDKILLDAPCSSEGYGRKNSSFFEKMWFEKNIHESSQLQKKLIISAFEMLAPGGEMVYSTCTSAPEENEPVVQHLIDKFEGSVELLPIEIKEIPHTNGIGKFYDQNFSSDISNNVVRLWPHMRSEKWNSEIFFIAKIKKTHAISRRPKISLDRKTPYNILSKNQSAEITTRITKTWGIDKTIFKNYKFLDRNGEISIASDMAAYFGIKNAHRRVGIPIFDKYKNPTTEFSTLFGAIANKNIVQITETDSQKFLTGLDIEYSGDVPESTPLLIRSGHFCIGWGKAQPKNGKIKNKLDRKLI
jgi:16S rRNA (cytosine1407-C5)-methyltransferase